MFQKLKEKITEEVKQSSLKFPVSVKQITQTVSASTSPSKLPSLEPNEEKECKESCESPLEDAALNSEYDSSFTTIDLRSPTPHRNRRSSSSSDLFPIYEFPSNRLNFQSDLESNSEFDDGSSIHQGTNVSKEILFEKYRNMQQKYHKYRGRFVDMRKCCMEMEREYDKIKNILTETQDKAIRRTKELKEQCALEQTAKAHLEGVLRNELEERDLIISTLNTKIKLLKSGKDSASIGEQHKTESGFQNVTITDKISNSNSFLEVEVLKDKIKNFELLLSKAKEALTTKHAQIRNFESKIDFHKSELRTSQEQVAELQNKIDLMKHKEEEALLSLAENKMTVHKELEAKEKHIKILEDKVYRYENEIKKLKNKKDQKNTQSNAENFKSFEKIDDKDETIRNLNNELLQLKMLKNNIESQNETTSMNDVTEKSQTELGHMITQSKQNFEEVEKLSTKLEECIKKIEEQKLFISEKEKELDLLRIAKDNEISRLDQIKIEQENEISILKTEVSQLNIELSKNSAIRGEVTALNDSLRLMRAELDDKDKQLRSNVETMNKLESELLNVKNKFSDSMKFQKMWEDAVTESKADKIIWEELMKTVKSELNVAQSDLKNAKSKMEKYENDLKNNEEVVKEKCSLEKQLQECQKNLKVVSELLQQAKKNEHEMDVQTANFLEEINKLKTKEDEYLRDIRILKSDLSKLRTECDEIKSLNLSLEQSRQQTEKVISENEIVKSENIDLKGKIDELKICLDELEKASKDKIAELREQNFLNHQRQKLNALFDDLKKSAEEVTTLKSENEKLISNNERILNEIQKLREENRLLLAESDSFQQGKLKSSSHLEKLKNLCQLDDDDSEEPEILQTAIQKLHHYSEEVNLIRTENAELKTKFDETFKKAEEVERYREANETLRSEKEELEKKLDEESVKFSELLSRYEQMQSHVENHTQSMAKNELIIDDSKRKSSQFAENSELLENNRAHSKNINGINENTVSVEEEIQLHDTFNVTNAAKIDANENIDFLNGENDILKTQISNLETSNKITSSLRAIILQIWSQLQYLKAENEKVRNDLTFFSKFFDESPTSGEEINLKKIISLVDSFEKESESVRNELFVLRKEKKDLLEKIENLEIKAEELKKRSEETIHQRELFFSEKYSQEMKEIITGYEKRLAEKDNEYEALQNKLNLRVDRENTAMYRETKEIIENLQEELTIKQDAHAELLVKYKNEMDEFNEKLSEQKENYAKELRENDKKWRSCLDKKIEEVEEKYKEEINELTKEWNVDRKLTSAPTEMSIKDNEEFLEDAAKQSEDSEMLRKQIQILTVELNNCKRSHWREIDLNLMNVSYGNIQHSDISLEDCTEMEYLRNILFKYMMGHQPLVLAKVLAAVVKFDNNQTEQILQREEQKQSLMGQLGFT